MPTFWKKSLVCLVCGTTFEAVRVFTDAIRIKDRDSDLKPTYEGVNYLLFQPITCPNCFYTTFEEDFGKPVKPEVLEKLKKLTAKLKNAVKIDLSENRTLKDGISIYTIMTAVYMLMEKPLKTAEAYLKLAWLYREFGSEEEEKKALKSALNFFLESYTKEALSDEQQAMVLFYLGEINRRLGNKKDAIKWFSQLIKTYGGSNSLYVKLARTQWQEVASEK
ncbi:DUF2225 domain-containing protein [Pseudothermotoga thermarum]|uniref:DUF2225 domain-containing protein n=1 Tax=Pseudothermotoga thermarum DSM 5069 TaxID=688269 RepID=F7YV62_9THEM|nr:DUF2225 domain-containing protein [Pseudothermotoga thermarum]AEH50361.1 Protein of unknown function DUF2225 [Pseudothermotoga thermarum DSM 5069]